MFFTTVPTQEQIMQFKGNRGKRGDQIVFKTREEAEAYITEARAYIDKLQVNHRTQGSDVPLYDELKIRTYVVPSKVRRKIVPASKRRRFMILGAHFDDELVGTGGLACLASEQGHEVYVLTFCGGSSGRADHFLTEEEGWVARLYETLLGAKEVGILEIHVMIGPNGIGLPEWFWGTDAKWIREIGVRLARMYNIHYIIAHHPDPRVDSHFDHPPVGQIALVWKAQGQWTDHHGFFLPDARIISGETIIAPEVWFYVVWAGKVNPEYNLYLRFNLKIARRIGKAIGYHRTQTVPVKQGPWGIKNSYALATLLTRLAMRFWLDVNNPDIYFVEGYVRMLGATTVTELSNLWN